MKIREGLGDKSGLLASYSHLTDYYEQYSPELSIIYSRKLLEVARENNSEASRLEALKKLAGLLPPNEALQYSQRYMKLHDSIDRTNHRAKNRFAKIRFDEEQKQQEILGLEIENARQISEKEQLKNRNIILSLIALLGAVGTGFILYYFRQKNRKEKIQEVQKTETRISKMIHDELANDLYNLMSILEPVAPVSAIDKLESIYLRTRDISRENSDFDTGEAYLPNLISALSYIASGKAGLILKGEKSVNWQKVSEEKKIVIYRVLQESMINMKKHSKARTGKYKSVIPITGRAMDRMFCNLAKDFGIYASGLTV